MEAIEIWSVFNELSNRC